MKLTIVGAEMSLNEKLVDLIHEIEDGNRQQSWENLTELGVLAPALGRTGEETIAVPTI
jgi:hypothetical protein